MSDKRSAVGYLVRSYPRLSQTFILHEMLALEAEGAQLHVFSITNPREKLVQREVASLRAPVTYLDEGAARPIGSRVLDLIALLRRPLRLIATLWYLLMQREIDRGYAASTRWECLVHAAYLLQLLDAQRRQGIVIEHLHAHFAHDPTLIAQLARRLSGISYSFTAHARDLYQIPTAALRDRVAEATTMLTCCGANLDYVFATLPQPLHARVELLHHGVDLDGFRPATRGATPDEPLILSVGRLVEKKGFDTLLRVCQRLKQAEYRFRCRIYGEGPLRSQLEALAAELDIADRVVFMGACSQRELVPVFQQAELFMLTPFVTEDGDRDGVPNVLVEAMACGLPVVSTRVAGVPELIDHERNGFLAEPRDIDALAVYAGALLDDAGLQARLGEAARRTVREHFDLRRSARRLAQRFAPSQPAARAMVAGNVIAAGTGDS